MNPKAVKGQYGYISRQKKVRFFRCLLMFAIPAAIFIIGLIVNQGDNKSIYSVIAMVGCIPGCLAVVNFIMMMMRKPMDPQLYREISEHMGDLVCAYELYLTTYDKNLFLDAVAFCGDYVMAYTHEKVNRADIDLMEEHIRKTYRGQNYKATVKIYDQKKGFLERLDTMNEKKEDYMAQAAEHFRPYENYPDLDKSNLLKHMLMAAAL